MQHTSWPLHEDEGALPLWHVHISQGKRAHGVDDVHVSPMGTLTPPKTTPRSPRRVLVRALELDWTDWQHRFMQDTSACGRALTASAKAAVRRIEGRILEIVRGQVRG